MSTEGKTEPTKLDAKTTRLYDVRTVERNIKKGLITRKDYERHLKSLTDVTVKAAASAADDSMDDDDDLDDEDEDIEDEDEPADAAGGDSSP